MIRTKDLGLFLSYDHGRRLVQCICHLDLSHRSGICYRTIPSSEEILDMTYCSLSEEPSLVYEEARDNQNTSERDDPISHFA